MTRKEELMSVFKDADEKKKSIMLPLINEVVFLEQQLDKLKKMPFIKSHPNNQELQKATPAAKQYKELLQQYANCIKILGHVSGTDEGDNDSPLRRWAKKHMQD